MRTVRGILGMGAVAAIVIVGCAGASGRLPMPEELLAPGPANQTEAIAALGRGRALTVTACVDCHRMYWPHERTPQAWPALARKMGRLASLSARQIQDLERYLVAASRAGRRREALPTATDR